MKFFKIFFLGLYDYFSDIKSSIRNGIDDLKFLFCNNIFFKWKCSNLCWAVSWFLKIVTHLSPGSYTRRGSSPPAPPLGIPGGALPHPGIYGQRLKSGVLGKNKIALILKWVFLKSSWKFFRDFRTSKSNTELWYIIIYSPWIGTTMGHIGDM